MKKQNDLLNKGFISKETYDSLESRLMKELDLEIEAKKEMLSDLLLKRELLKLKLV